MAIPVDDVRHAAPIPAQRRDSASPSAVPDAATAEVLPAARGLVRAAAPTTADVVVGAVTWALGTVRSATDVGVLAGHVALDRLPIPGPIRRRARRAWFRVGSAGLRQREHARTQLGALLDVLVPELVRTLLGRLDVTALVSEFVDLDDIAAGLDVDAVAARLDVDRVVDRVDLDRAVARVDLNRIVERIDLDDVASRIDLDRILDRVDLDELAARLDLDRVIERADLDRVIDRLDLDRAAARLDLDPILERADVVGLARYVIDAIDLPALIRSSTGSMTSEVVRGVRAQGADADEAVQRVVDRLLRRRSPRNDLAPGGER